MGVEPGDRVILRPTVDLAEGVKAALNSGLLVYVAAANFQINPDPI
jgi:hypothetical protein